MHAVILVLLASSSSRGGYNGFITPIQTYGVDDLGASDKELVDFQLADLPTGSHLHPSLG